MAGRVNHQPLASYSGATLLFEINVTLTLHQKHPWQHIATKAPKTMKEDKESWNSLTKDRTGLSEDENSNTVYLNECMR